MFGLNKRSNLIRSLVSKRLSIRGEMSPDNVNFINSLGSFKLNSLPEATIVAVLDAVVKAERQGLSTYDAIGRQENIRGIVRSDRKRFQTIRDLSQDHPYGALIEYMAYRIELESNSYGQLSSYEIMQLVSMAKPVIEGW